MESSSHCRCGNTKIVIRDSDFATYESKNRLVNKAHSAIEPLRPPWNIFEEFEAT